MSSYIPIIVASILYLIRVQEFFVKRDTVKGPVKEKTSFALLFLGGTLVTFGAMAEHLIFDRSSSYAQVIIGALITLGAFAYRNWAIRTLGKFWSVHVEIRENHELVDYGPFKRVRHPVYTAAIGELVGITLILSAFLSSLAILIVVVPSIFFRIRLEEKALIDKFGSKYREYLKTTGALSPKFFSFTR